MKRMWIGLSLGWAVWLCFQTTDTANEKAVPCLQRNLQQEAAANKPEPQPELNDQPRLEASTKTSHWAGFRGDGSSTLRAETFPLRWSPEQGIAWRTERGDYEEMGSPRKQQRRAQIAVLAERQKSKRGPEAPLDSMPEAQLHKMFSYGDPTVYGVAAVDGHLVIRTGQLLYGISGEKANSEFNND